MFSKRFEKAAFKTAVKENVKTLYRKTIDEATPQQLFQAVSYAVKDVIIDDWIDYSIIQLQIFLCVLLYIINVKISTRRLLTLIVRKIGGFFCRLKIF